MKSCVKHIAAPVCKNATNISYPVFERLRSAKGKYIALVLSTGSGERSCPSFVGLAWWLLLPLGGAMPPRCKKARCVEYRGINGQGYCLPGARSGR